MVQYRVTSDTHFWHQMLVEAGIRKNWFERWLFNKLNNIPKDDVLFHLWDILIGKDSELHEKYIKPLKCKKILIMWNHDRKNAMRYMNHWRDFACNFHLVNLDKKHIILSHRPIDWLPEWWYNLHWHRHQKANPPFSEYHYLYSPELEKFFPKKLEHCLVRYE